MTTITLPALTASLLAVRESNPNDLARIADAVLDLTNGVDDLLAFRSMFTTLMRHSFQGDDSSYALSYMIDVLEARLGEALDLDDPRWDRTIVPLTATD